MTNGILIFAHNSNKVDYVSQAIIAAGLAKKYLNVPATLVSDSSSIKKLKRSSKNKLAREIFENIIEIDLVETNNSRILHNGNEFQKVPFINSNRANAWELTPYDRTLLIDSDFLIFSGTLSEYWNYNSSFLIGSSMLDILDSRYGFQDKCVSDEGIPMYWATTIMFTKNAESKLYFDMVSFIRDNYQTYSKLFNFDSKIYRNDIAFSIAKHVIEGFETKDNLLPPILTVQDKDIIYDVNELGIKFLIKDKLADNRIISNISKRDVHVMNKISIVDNYKKLIKLI